MRRYVDNTSEIKKRGGSVLSDSGFVVIACCCCLQQYLYDEELLRIYLSPVDLTVTTLDIDGERLPCVGCGDTEWSHDVLDLDSEAVAAGQWAWLR